MSSGRITRDHRYSITPEHLTLDPRVGDRAFRLWNRLDRYAGEDGAAMPSRESLAIELKTSPSSIDRAQRELVAAGWLRVIPRPGTSNNYVLITAPTAAVMKLVEEARAKEKMETVGRRERATERRRARKQRQKEAGNVESSPNPQVSAGGLTTSDDTPAEGGLTTGDETGLTTGDERGLTTGDEEKEASLKEASDEGRSDSSLRSSSAEPSDGALPGLSAPEGDDENDPRVITGAFLEWFKDTHNGGRPIFRRERAFHSVCGMVKVALADGYSVKEIKLALTKSRSSAPSVQQWEELLRAATGGVTPPSRFAAGTAYRDDDVHGTPEEREKVLAERKALSDEEVQDQVDAMFSPRAHPARESA